MSALERGAGQFVVWLSRRMWPPSRSIPSETKSSSQTKNFTPPPRQPKHSQGPLGMPSSASGFWNIMTQPIPAAAASSPPGRASCRRRSVWNTFRKERQSGHSITLDMLASNTNKAPPTDQLIVDQRALPSPSFSASLLLGVADSVHHLHR